MIGHSIILTSSYSAYCAALSSLFCKSCLTKLFSFSLSFWTLMKNSELLILSKICSDSYKVAMIWLAIFSLSYLSFSLFSVSARTFFRETSGSFWNSLSTSMKSFWKVIWCRLNCSMLEELRYCVAKRQSTCMISFVSLSMIGRRIAPFCP